MLFIILGISASCSYGLRIYSSSNNNSNSSSNNNSNSSSNNNSNSSSNSNGNSKYYTLFFL